MDKKAKIKIKDSVDLFLSNRKYLMVYYMNSRQRKSFHINDEMIHLFEEIDGEHTIEDITHIMEDKWEINANDTDEILQVLVNNRIITEVLEKQNILPDYIMDKYSRQINYFSEFLGSELMGIKAQKKVIDSHIVIFGCGAVGGNIALQLAMAGVGTISLFDRDRVEKSDVSRHMFYRYDNIGEPKVEALKRELIKINPDIKVKTYLNYLQPHTDLSDLIEKVDFVVNTLDEPYIGYTAAKISRVCMKFQKPHYIAGGFDAHLASTGELIIPYVTPCVECYATHFKDVLKDWKPLNHPVPRRYEEIGGLACMSLFSSSYACIEILKYIAGLIPMTEKYKIRGEFLFHDMSLTYLNVKKNPECPVCGGMNYEP